MSGKIQVGPLSGFTPVSGIENVWRKGRLSLSLLTALGSARLEQSIRDLLENTLEADSILIVAFGYAPADAVWALNQRGVTDIVIADFLGTDEKWRNLVPLRFADYVEADVLRQQLATGAGAFGRFRASTSAL